MKSRIFFLMLVALALSAYSAASAENNFIASNPDLYARGELVYAANCAACHGINGQGQFPDAPLEPDATGRYGAPPHNEAGHTWHHDDDLLIQIVREGGMGSPEAFYPMPAFGQILTDDDLQAVLVYIKGFWTEEQRTFQRQSTERARQ